ncbi:MAG: hypothetical protein R3C68_03115 [Myxococcota bacterium]
MYKQINPSLLIAALSAGLLFSACGGTNNKTPGDADPTFEIDATVIPQVQDIPFADGTGSRPVARITDDKGHGIDFVQNEVSSPSMILRKSTAYLHA